PPPDAPDAADALDDSPTVSYQLQVNGTSHEVTEGWVGESLLYVLRERLGLPGSKSACEQGECGSCSVLLDDTLVCSCLVPAATAQGADIRTVESMGTTDALSDVQQAFVDAGAVQCGFCTPGLVMTVHCLLASSTTPSELEVREAISGNLCRCTGYGRIFDAIARVVATRSDGSSSAEVSR
ncbi:MAG: (2Fe-2S)-binding protein, partial [Acidimicrobiia bacterium]